MRNLVMELCAAVLGIPVGGFLMIALINAQRPKPWSWGWNEALIFVLGGVAGGFLFGLLTKKLAYRWMVAQQPPTTEEKTALAITILSAVAWSFFIGRNVENPYYKVPLQLLGVSLLTMLGNVIVTRWKNRN